MAGKKMGAAGANASLVSFSRGRKQAAVTAAQDQRARVASNGQCPSCGSSNFEQYKPGAAPPVAAAASGAWHPDPSGRFHQRWWDGARWTEHVMDAAGVAAVDRP